MARQDQLIKLHYEEIALDKNQIPLNPDWESYQRWLDEWRKTYKSIALECKNLKGKNLCRFRVDNSKKNL